MPGWRVWIQRGCYGGGASTSEIAAGLGNWCARSWTESLPSFKTRHNTPRFIPAYSPTRSRNAAGGQASAQGDADTGRVTRRRHVGVGWGGIGFARRRNEAQVGGVVCSVFGAQHGPKGSPNILPGYLFTKHSPKPSVSPKHSQRFSCVCLWVDGRNALQLRGIARIGIVMQTQPDITSSNQPETPNIGSSPTSGANFL